MAASIAGTLTGEQIQQALNQAKVIANSASQTINSNQFVFFGAFDGTNNNANDPSSIPAGEQTTNIGQLWSQYKNGITPGSNLGGNYYPGPGTSDSLLWSSWSPSQVTQEAINTGTRAYEEFQDQARAWLKANPNADPATSIAVAITSFSRGIDAASVFAQLLYEKGLTNSDGTVLIPPGQLGISAGVIFDPVATGMSGNIGFPLAQNVVVIQADNEYRYLFEAVNYADQPGFMTFNMLGNHCDIGGCYDTSSGSNDSGNLGAINLQGATGFLQHSGLILADVPAERQFDASQDTVVHNEAMDDYSKEMWSAYGTYGEYAGPRLTSSVVSRPSTVEVMADGAIVETFVLYDGRTITHTIAADGSVTTAIKETGAGTLQNAIGLYAGTLIDALTLLKAIQSGEPLPLVASGLKVANDLSNLNDVPNLNLSGSAYLASGVLSLMSLNAALEQGDALGSLTAGAQTVVFGATAYANFADYANLSEAIKEGAFGDASGALGAISDALPYLSIVNSLAHEDYTGAAVYAVSIYVPYVGWAYAVYSIFDSLFDDDDVPDPWGSARYVWNGNGISYQAAGESGGYEAVSGVMNSTLATLNALIEQIRQQNPGSQLGIIPNRMPSVAYDMSGYRYVDIDPLTGVEQHPGLRFDTFGRPYNAQPGSLESYQSIIEGMVRSALSRGAIAPLWEVQTAKMQSDAGDPKAGLTEEERAGRDGKLAAPITGNTQTFRPVVLDLDGDGIEVTDKAHGVAFDVDDSGYLKQTAWIKGDDALLVLDRNYNGQFDSGRELFSNGLVDLSRRGLAGMAWVDANYDGKLTAADPVWSELKIWRDLDQDGQQDAGEVWGLGELGITELNYVMGTFTQNGVKKQLGSPDLEADSQGSRVSIVPEGILVQTSTDGHISLIVTRVVDKSGVEDNPGGGGGSGDGGTNGESGGSGGSGNDPTMVKANRDGITGYEDVEIIVSSADLLANDTVNGAAGQGLTMTGLSNFRHGTGFIDANGFVHFIPEADYAGEEAGFDYAVVTADGVTGSATVDITLQNINDPPTLDHVDHVTKPVYGYTPIVYATNTWGEPTGIYASGGNPIYEPYADSIWYDTVVYNPPPGLALQYHTTPIATEDTGVGRVIGADVDDPATSLTYEVVGLPQYGAVTVNPDGTFQYTSWKEPGVASDRIVIDGQYAGLTDQYGSYMIQVGENNYFYDALYYPGYLPSNAVYPTTDVFQVKITDPHGASTIQSIEVPHYGPYFPPQPSSGGGGGKKPIAVDLDGNGFEFVNVDDSNVFFDVNGDGWKRRTSWIGQNDGLLVYDIDGDGKIDKPGEISFARYVDGAQSDLEGLRAFDSNGDGRFDAADEKWAKFGVWQDANQNGVTDPGEFRSLSEMGIVAINLTSNGQFQIINGQTVHGVGSMIRADGSEIAIADVTFAYGNEVQMPQGETVNVSPFSPDGEEIDGTEGNDLILGKNGNNIIKGFGGDDVIFEDGGNDIIDGGDGNDLIYSGADNDLVFGGAGDDVIYAGLGDDVVFGGDGNDAIFGEGGNDIIFGGAGNDLISGGWGNDVLSGDDGDDQIFGESGNDALFGGAGDDELYGMDGDDYLNGGAGSDLLDGGAGADTLIGGSGNDTLNGGLGNNTYIFGKGDGQDLITFTYDATADKLNVLQFDAGIKPSEVRASRSGDNLVLSIGDGSDKVTVQYFFYNNTPGNSAYNPIQEVRFADGTVLTAADVFELSKRSVIGTDGADTITIGSDGIFVDGRGGDDRILFESSNATIYGGSGDDTISGSGDNVMIDGGSGDDVIVHHGGGSNVLRGGDGNDTITFSNSANNTIEGGAGDDLIMADNLFSNTSNANIFNGGPGNDRFLNGNSADTYLFNRGDGQDSINDYGYNSDVEAGEDRIVFGEGITPDDVTVSHSGAGLVLKINDPNNPAATDQITIECWDIRAARIEYVHFADGTVWTADDLSNRAMTGTDDADEINVWSDATVVDGKGGDDTIIACSYGATIYGGDGNDTISFYGNNNVIDGGDGNDTIIFGFYNTSNNTIKGGAGDDLIQVDYNAGSCHIFTNIFSGGTGNDRIESGASTDTYLFNRGDGQDTINDYGYNGFGDPDYGPGDDQIIFGAGISADQLWFQRVANNLEVSIIGTTDKMTIEDWYLDSVYHIEQFKTDDGKTLLDNQVDSLVSAMAAFAPPASGQTSLPPDYQNTLNAVIAANWK